MVVINNNYCILGEQIIISSDRWVRVRMRVRVCFCFWPWGRLGQSGCILLLGRIRKRNKILFDCEPLDKRKNWVIFSTLLSGQGGRTDQQSHLVVKQKLGVRESRIRWNLRQSTERERRLGLFNWIPIWARCDAPQAQGKNHQKAYECSELSGIPTRWSRETS